MLASTGKNDVGTNKIRKEREEIGNGSVCAFVYFR
jgi:hypothetical protein